MPTQLELLVAVWPEDQLAEMLSRLIQEDGPLPDDVCPDDDPDRLRSMFLAAIRRRRAAVFKEK